MDFSLIFLIGLVVGVLLGEALLAYRIQKVFKTHSLISTHTDLTQPHVFKLFIESEQNILYLYEYEKNEFVCQANTVEDLAVLAQKCKNIEYAAVLYGDESLMFINGTVKRKNEN
jgi:hypothetical protein